jgi:hypothetical protein
MSLNIIFLFSLFFLINFNNCLENENEIQKLKLKNFDELKSDKNSFKINTDFEILGTLISDKVTTKYLEINGDLKITEEAKVDNMKISKLDTNFAKVKKIIPPNGVLTIKGNVILTDKNINNIQKKNNNKDNENNFLQIDDDSYEENESWQLVEFDDFESKQSFLGWSDKKFGVCGYGNKNRFLGGKCNFSNKEVSKTFKNLPIHSQLRIKAVYHMIDYWNNERGYMDVDGHREWSKRGNSKEFGMKVCGKGEYNDGGYNNIIDVIIDNHFEEQVKITFGSTLDEDACKHSYAFDNVQIYVK